MRAEGPPLPRGPLQLAPFRSALLAAGHLAKPWLVTMAAALALAAESGLHPPRAESALETGEQRGALPGPGSGTGTLVDMDPGAWPWVVPCQGRALVRAVLASLRGTQRDRQVAPPLAGALAASTHARPRSPARAYKCGLPWTCSPVVSPVPALLPTGTSACPLVFGTCGLDSQSLCSRDHLSFVGVVWVLTGVVSSGYSVE